MEQQRREEIFFNSQAQNPRNPNWKLPPRLRRQGSYGRTQCGADMCYRRKEKEDSGENFATEGSSREYVREVPYKAATIQEARREDERQRKEAEAGCQRVRNKPRRNRRGEQKRKLFHQERSHSASDLHPEQSVTITDVVLGQLSQESSLLRFADRDAHDKSGASSQYEMLAEEKARVADWSNTVLSNTEVMISQYSPQMLSSENSQIAPGFQNIEGSREEANGDASAAMAGPNEVQGFSPAPEAGAKPSAVQPMRPAVVLPPSIQPSTVLPLQFGQVQCTEWDQIVFSGNVSAENGHPVQAQRDMPIFASNLQQDAVDEECLHVFTRNDQDEILQLDTLMPNDVQLQETCDHQVLHKEPSRHHLNASEVTPLKLAVQGVVQHEQAHHVIRVPVPSQLSSQISQSSSSSSVPLEDPRTSLQSEVAVASESFAQMQMVSDAKGLLFHPYCSQTSSNHSQPNFWQSHFLSEPQIMSSRPTLAQPQQSIHHQNRVPVPCQVDPLFIQQNVQWHQYQEYSHQAPLATHHAVHISSPGHHHPDLQQIQLAEPTQAGRQHHLFPGKVCLTPQQISQVHPHHLHFTGLQLPGQPVESVPSELKYLEHVHLAQPRPQLPGWPPGYIMLPQQAWRYPYIQMTSAMAGCSQHVGHNSHMTAESSGSDRFSEPSLLHLAHAGGQSPSNVSQSVWWQSEVEAQTSCSVDVHQKGSASSGSQLPAPLHTQHQLTDDDSVTEDNVVSVLVDSVSSEIEHQPLSQLQKGAGSPQPVLAAQSALEHALNAVAQKQLSGHGHISGSHTLVQGLLPRGSGPSLDSEIDRVAADASGRTGGKKAIASSPHYDGDGDEPGSPSQRASLRVQVLDQQYQNGSHVGEQSVNGSTEQRMLDQGWHQGPRQMHSELLCPSQQLASLESSQQFVVPPRGKHVEDEESSPCVSAQQGNGYQEQLVMSEQAPRGKEQQQIQQGSFLQSQHSGESPEWERPNSLHGQASRQQGAYMPLGKPALQKTQEPQQQRSLDQRQQTARSRYDPMLQQRAPPEISSLNIAHRPQTCGVPTPWDMQNASSSTMAASRADALIAQSISAFRAGPLLREAGGQGTERVPLREQRRRDQLNSLQQHQQSWPAGQALGNHTSQFVLPEELSQLDMGGNLVSESDMLLQQHPNSSALGTVSDEITDQVPDVSELITDGLQRNGTPLSGDIALAAIQQHGGLNMLQWGTLHGAETAGKLLGNHTPSTMNDGLHRWKDVVVGNREEAIQKSKEDGETLPEEEKNIEALLGMLTVDKEEPIGAGFDDFTNNRVHNSEGINDKCILGNGVTFAPSSMPCSLQFAEKQAVHGRGSLKVDGEPRRPGIEVEASCKEGRRSAEHVTLPPVNQKAALLPTPVQGIYWKTEQQQHISGGQIEWSVQQKRGRRNRYNKQRTIVAKEQGQDCNRCPTAEHGQNAYQLQRQSAQPMLEAREDDDARFKEDIERAISESLATATATVEVDPGDHSKSFCWNGGVSPIESTVRNVQLGESGSLNGEAVDPLQQEHLQMVAGKGLANEFGQYNCFLNVVIQSLWHIPAFRNVFVSQEQHQCVGNPCVVCALKDIFVALRLQPKDSVCQESAISPTCLRLALCALGSKQNRFQEGQMHDASEFLLFLFECLHKACSLYRKPEQGLDLLDGSDPGRGTSFNDWECKVVDDEANKERCLVHSVFGMDVVERMDCSSCKVRSRQLKYTSFSHNVNAKLLRTTKASHPRYHFDELLNATSTSDRRLCDPEVGGCGKRDHLVHILREAPHVFTIVLGWQNTREHVDDIRSTLKAIDTDIDVGKIYDGVDKGTRHHLVSVVCYYGQHYHCFALNQDLDQWIKFDDSNVKVVGRWDEVARICQTGRLQPQVLFYEAGCH